jgi:signal transduction histidine kinase
MVQSLLVYHNVVQYKRHLTEVDVSVLLDDLQSTLSFLIDQTQGSLSVQGNMRMLLDENQMRQLLWHLLYNALKFHRPDVPPKVQVGLGRLAEGQGEIVIRDNGIGFDQRQEKEIFSPFKRLHHYRKYSGSGIGLSLCRKIMDSYHGDIQVVSEKGRGTTFTLVFPVNCFKGSV